MPHSVVVVSLLFRHSVRHSFTNVVRTTCCNCRLRLQGRACVGVRVSRSVASAQLNLILNISLRQVLRRISHDALLVRGSHLISKTKFLALFLTVSTKSHCSVCYVSISIFAFPPFFSRFCKTMLRLPPRIKIAQFYPNFPDFLSLARTLFLLVNSKTRRRRYVVHKFSLL